MPAISTAITATSAKTPRSANKLPDGFMAQLPEYVETAQIVYPFGGEPFFFSPVIDFMADHNANTETRFF